MSQTAEPSSTVGGDPNGAFLVVRGAQADTSSKGQVERQAVELFAMKPSRCPHRVGENEIRFGVRECSLGSVLVAASARGVCAILLGDDPDELVRDLQNRFSGAMLVEGDLEFEAVVTEVVRFVEAPDRGLDLPLDMRGTAFQERVWRALGEIPPGSTVSYAELAARIGAPKSARAVGRAVGANPLAVAIPCHRVIRNDGMLSGYRWGVERKRTLLERERRR